MARAEAAHAKITAHEDLCALRYQQIADSNTQIHGQMNRMEALIEASAKERKSDIKGIYDFLWKVALGIGGSMLAIILLLVKEIISK